MCKNVVYFIFFLSICLHDLLTANIADKMEESYFAFPYHWILFNVSLISDRILLNELRVLPDSDVTIVHYNDITHDYGIQQSSSQQFIPFFSVSYEIVFDLQFTKPMRMWRS